MSGSTDYANDPKWLALTDALLDRLRGKLSLIQPAHERRQLALAALEGLYSPRHGDHLPAMATDQAREAFLGAFFSYDLVEDFLSDPSVEDIMISATEPIFVHRTGVGLVKTQQRFSSTPALLVFIKKLIVFGGRSELDPINDVELADVRGRVNIIASPFGPQITITRGKPQPLTILQLIDSGMLSAELAAQLWIYVEGLRIRPANLIISGGPGTGKTTLLNALLSFIPPNERIVIIEDTLELNTSFLESCSRLESCRRVEMPALVKNSLRMRPERILVGEVRGEEARDLMTAMSLGKYCMGTVHASTARETILRLQNEPMNVPPILVSLVDAFIMVRKLQADGKISRAICEVVETGGMEQDVVLLSHVWRYDPEHRRIIDELPSSTYRDHLATEAGLTTTFVMEETARRAGVLKAMQASKRYSDIAAVTRFCQLYSEHPEQALDQLGMKAEAAKPPKKQ